jgi:hypothetical protein
VGAPPEPAEAGYRGGRGNVGRHESRRRPHRRSGRNDRGHRGCVGGIGKRWRRSSGQSGQRNHCCRNRRDCDAPTTTSPNCGTHGGRLLALSWWQPCHRCPAHPLRRRRTRHHRPHSAGSRHRVSTDCIGAALPCSLSGGGARIPEAALQRKVGHKLMVARGGGYRVGARYVRAMRTCMLWRIRRGLRPTALHEPPTASPVRTASRAARAAGLPSKTWRQRLRRNQCGQPLGKPSGRRTMCCA